MAEAESPIFAYAGFFAPHTQDQDRRGTRLPEPTPANATAGSATSVATRAQHPRQGRPSAASMPLGPLAALHAARVRALYDVDDEVADTFELLESTGLLADTVVLFISDNGYSLGQNGWEAKAVPYPGSRSIPMLA